MKGLGRKIPKKWDHVERYPIGELRMVPTRVPVTLGINWYSGFDNPELKDGILWIGNKFGYLRGGHAVCLKPEGIKDSWRWWNFYDQGNEGACVGFACARMMGLLNRRRYDGFSIYKAAQEIDEWSDTPPGEGTSVKAGCDILRTLGAKAVRIWGITDWNLRHGIIENRWATTWDEIRLTLGVSNTHDGVPLLNSWGTYYPHKVRLTDEAGERLLHEYGEASIVTDR